MNINPCPMCGSSAKVYATGASECYGYAWQSYGVECNDDFDEHCLMDISVNADFFNLYIDDNTVIKMWNMINVRPSIRTS